MPKLEYFKYIIKIAEAQSISRAAEELYISQPYLSMEIKHLEEELGVTLLIRTSRGVQLTPEGEKFLWYAYRICKDADLAYTSLKGNDAPDQEKLSITSIYSFTMLDIFQSFSHKNHAQQFSFHYEETPNQYIAPKVAAGRSDIGIVYLLSTTKEASLRQFEGLDLRFTPLFSEELYAVVGASHPLAKCGSVTLQMLSSYPLVVEKIKNLSKLENAEDNLLFPELFKGMHRMPLTFDNNRSLMYYLTGSNQCFSVGQKGLNLTNPFVKSRELRYIPILDAGVSLTTGYLISTRQPATRFMDAYLRHMTNALDALDIM